jgi:hypothetical protein
MFCRTRTCCSARGLGTIRSWKYDEVFYLYALYIYMSNMCMYFIMVRCEGMPYPSIEVLDLRQLIEGAMRINMSHSMLRQSGLYFQ